MKTKESKNQLINDLLFDINNNTHFYLTDMSCLSVEKTNSLRKICFQNDVKIKVVKNSLLQKAMEKSEKNYSEFFPSLHGSTSIMFSETGNVPAKIIKNFRKSSDKPILKAAYVEESVYIGDNQVDILLNIKSRNELIGDVILLLQSPPKRVISSLLSSKNKIAGIIKTLSEKSE